MGDLVDHGGGHVTRDTPLEIDEGRRTILGREARARRPVRDAPEAHGLHLVTERTLDVRGEALVPVPGRSPADLARVVAPHRGPGPDRVGVRLAPLTTLNGTVDANPQETYLAAARLLGQLGVVYLHVAEADWDDAPLMAESFKQGLRDTFPNTLIYAGKYDGERARAAIEAGWADMIGFGRPFVANPDLPNRLRHGHPFAPHDPATLFGGGEKGLTDYPVYGAERA